MTYIHERSGWPSFTWQDSALTAPLALVRHRQGRLLGRMETLGFDLRQEASLATLTIDVIKSSAIEGEDLNRDEVRSSLARRLGLDAGGLSPSGRHVEGIVEMMLDATQNHEAVLTAERLFGWHATLFPSGRSGMTRIAVGAWRTKESDPMQVISGSYNRKRVHFEAPGGDQLDAEMAAFLDWFNNGPVVDPVLKAGIAHLWFVTIHPFEDGNGRIARAIADLALARADDCRERFYSMSGQIEAERNAYYEELERQQRADVDITGWLAWFLDCLDRALTAAESTLSAVLTKARLWERINQGPMNDRQRVVINRLMGEFHGPLNSSKYAKLAKCSTDTALRDIQALVDRRVLVQNPAGGRSTSYRLATLDEIAE